MVAKISFGKDLLYLKMRIKNSMKQLQVNPVVAYLKASTFIVMAYYYLMKLKINRTF